jgi:hypothetical protein
MPPEREPESPMRTPGPFLVAAVLVAWEGAAVGEQPLAAVPEPGAVLRYAIESRLEVSGEGGEPIAWCEQAVVVRLVGVSAGRVRTAFESLDARWRMEGGEARVFAWREGEPGEGEEPASRMYRALAESVIEIEVAPAGAVTSASGFERALEAGRGLPPQERARALGVLAPGSFERTMALLLRVGDDAGDGAYVDARRAPVGGDEIEMVMRYAREGGEAGRIELSAESEVVLVAGAEPADGTPPILRIESGKATSRVWWEGGAVARREETFDALLAGVLGEERPLEARVRAAGRVTIRRAEP